MAPIPTNMMYSVSQKTIHIIHTQTEELLLVSAIIQYCRVQFKDVASTFKDFEF